MATETLFCDWCGTDLVTRDGITGQMVPTGRVDAEFNVPVVEMVCHPSCPPTACQHRYPPNGPEQALAFFCQRCKTWVRE